MGITDSEILKTEKFGSREYERKILGRCAFCKAVVMKS